MGKSLPIFDFSQLAGKLDSLEQQVTKFMGMAPGLRKGRVLARLGRAGVMMGEPLTISSPSSSRSI
jgi:hypothetical protein